MNESTILILRGPSCYPLKPIRQTQKFTDTKTDIGNILERIILMNLARNKMIQTADELHLKEKVKKPIEKLLHVLNAS